jgi:hypothetical protein
MTISPLVVELRQKEKHSFVDLFLTNLINRSSNLICLTVIGKIGISKVVDAPGKNLAAGTIPPLFVKLRQVGKPPFVDFFLGESCKENRSCKNGGCAENFLIKI